MPLNFKTSEECRLELVAHTQQIVRLPDPSGIDLELRMSSNMLPVSAARASFGKEDKTGADHKADLKLMKFLADEGHTSVFEHQSATFLIECPMFVRSQIHRHRTFSYNEISRRYTAEQIEFWKPTEWRGQAKSNKQASAGVLGVYLDTEEEDGVDRTFDDVYDTEMTMALDYYERLLVRGVAREQARAVLPQSLLTRFYMTGNLRNWIHFIKLRTDPHAQREVQIVAERIRDELFKLWPEAMEVLIGKEEGNKTEEA